MSFDDWEAADETLEIENTFGNNVQNFRHQSDIGDTVSQ
jgi:hypothetical protein